MERLSTLLIIGNYYKDREGLIFRIVSELDHSVYREQDYFIGECVSRVISNDTYHDNSRVYTKYGGYGITPNYRDLIELITEY